MAAKKSFVILTLKFRKEGRYWLGECEELGTATDGQSLEKVRKELQSLVALHVNALEEAGELARVFQERGIKLYTDKLPAEVDRSLPISDDSETPIELYPVDFPIRALDSVAV